MSGQFRLADADAPLVPNTRIIFAFADGEPGLRFIDQRMFGGLSLSPGGAELPPDIAHIGRDPFDPEFDLADAVARMRQRNTVIKRAFLDQQLVSGIGNIYADEALWAARMHYARPTRTCRAHRPPAVITAAATVMRQRVSRWWHVLRRALRQHQWIRRLLRPLARRLRTRRPAVPALRYTDSAEPFMNRSSYRCPRCQRAPRGFVKRDARALGRGAPHL